MDAHDKKSKPVKIVMDLREVEANTFNGFRVYGLILKPAVIIRRNTTKIIISGISDLRTQSSNTKIIKSIDPIT